MKTDIISEFKTYSALKKDSIVYLLKEKTYGIVVEINDQVSVKTSDEVITVQED
jgi:hypothetical protein